MPQLIAASSFFIFMVHRTEVRYRRAQATGWPTQIDPGIIGRFARDNVMLCRDAAIFKSRSGAPGAVSGGVRRLPPSA